MDNIHFIGNPDVLIPVKHIFPKKIEGKDISQIHNTLTLDNFSILGQLLQLSRVELLRTPGLGHKGIDEIEARLAKLGYYLEDLRPLRNTPEHILEPDEIIEALELQDIEPPSFMIISRRISNANGDRKYIPRTEFEKAVLDSLPDDKREQLTVGVMRDASTIKAVAATLESKIA